MSFILIEREDNPVRLRGNRVIPSTITFHNKDGLILGDYVGFRSGLQVRLINYGGMILAAPEAKYAYKLGNLIPATLSEEVVHCHASELFVREAELPTVREYSFSVIHTEDMNQTYDEITTSMWIPGNIYVGQEQELLAWIKISTQEMVVIGMIISGEDHDGAVAFVPTMDSSKFISIRGIQCVH